MSTSLIPGYSGNVKSIVDRYNVATTGAPLTFPVNQVYTRVELYNFSAWGTSPSTPAMLAAFWNNRMTQGSANLIRNTANALTMQTDTVTANGIYMIDTGLSQLSPLVTGGTTITATNPAVATIPNTFQNGQVVRLTGVIGAPQLNNYEFTISNVSPTGFTIPFLDMSSFAAPVTAFNAQVVIPQSLFVTSASNFITAMTSVGTQTVITLAYAHNFFVNQSVNLFIPPQYGMNGLSQNVTGSPIPYVISAIDLVANTITIQADTSTLTNFAFPTATVWSQQHPSIPMVTPYGQTTSQPNDVMKYSQAQFVNPVPRLGLGSSVCGSSGGYIQACCYAETSIEDIV